VRPYFLRIAGFVRRLRAVIMEAVSALPRTLDLSERSPLHPSKRIMPALA